VVENELPANPGDLRAWAAGLEQEVFRLQDQLEGDRRHLALAEEKLNLVKRLMELDGTSTQGTAHEGSVQTAGVPENDGPRLRSSEVAPGELEDSVEAILADEGQPLHISKIRERLISKGVRIPGRGDDANIIVRIRKFENRFTRTARGTYALAAWGLPSLDDAKTRRRARARKQ
jgi:hypothetical protein